VHQEKANSHGHSTSTEGDFHQWAHEQLDLRPEQEEALRPVETAFHNERARLAKTLADAGHDLAHAILDHGRDSPELSAALLRINHLQLELQQLTLDHFFDMKAHLDPDQAQKLLEWTHDSISESN
jgi:Spy/CpxP family protein refolding chaperone